MDVRVGERALTTVSISPGDVLDPDHLPLMCLTVPVHRSWFVPMPGSMVRWTR